MTPMTLELAEECIRRVKAQATAMGLLMTIAVVDDAGKLVAFARMPRRSGSFGEGLAIAKARTAVAYGRDTKATMENFTARAGNYYIVGMSGLYPQDFWAGPGGVPLIVNGEVICGVGISGSAPELDHQCITEALRDLDLPGP
jgi:glc operon protein GlcG